MPTKTKIEWADYITNPIKAIYETDAYPLNGGHAVKKQGHGCVKYSEGCAHCWASTFNVRLGTGLDYTFENLGKVDFILDEKELARILKFNPRGPFKQGRSRAIVFPCDMTDIFGDWISDEWLDRLFFAMHMTSHVDWFVLTKRTDRMLNYFADKYKRGKVVFGNIYIGCTVENQKRANQRHDAMMAVSSIGWKTWVSYEPALEAVNWNAWHFLNGMVCGGESGHGARPMSVIAARDARDYCAGHDIPFFFKQWGEWIPLDHLAWVTDKTTFKAKPVDIDGVTMVRVGRGLAGNVLDGVRWSGMPAPLATPIGLSATSPKSKTDLGEESAEAE